MNVDVFEKNKDEEYMCPYNCRENYSYKRAYNVVLHIKARHDPSFDLKTFDPKKGDLDAWIPRKKIGLKRNPLIRSGGLLRMLGKRRRENHDNKSPQKKKRKLKI